MRSKCVDSVAVRVQLHVLGNLLLIFGFLERWLERARLFGRQLRRKRIQEKFQFRHREPCLPSQEVSEHTPNTSLSFLRLWSSSLVANRQFCLLKQSTGAFFTYLCHVLEISSASSYVTPVGEEPLNIEPSERNSAFTCRAFSADGSRMATGETNGTIRYCILSLTN